MRSGVLYFSLLLISRCIFAAEFALPDSNSIPTTRGAQDPIRQCLDNQRREKWKAKKKRIEPGMKGKSPFKFRKVTSEDLPISCIQGDLEDFKTALRHQINNCKKISSQAEPLNNYIELGCRRISREEWCLKTNNDLLKRAESTENFAEFVATIKNEFDWYQSEGFLEDQKNKKNETLFKKGDNQFTGYYSPELEAKSMPMGDFTYPVYERPMELVRFAKEDNNHCGRNDVDGSLIKWCLGQNRPLPDAERIYANELPGLKAIAYVKAKDAYNLALQGSGTLRVSVGISGGDIKKISIGYDGENGRPLSLLGNILKCIPPKPSEYHLDPNVPKEFKKILNYNRCFVFYKKMDPRGAEDIPVTAFHSMATDPTVIPIGAVTLFNTVQSGKTPIAGCPNMTSMAIAQDKGGAIVGPHYDLYKGSGKIAEAAANKVNSPGSIFIAVPRDAGTKIINCK